MKDSRKAGKGGGGDGDRSDNIWMGGADGRGEERKI